jgi:hypothetical protein
VGGEADGRGIVTSPEDRARMRAMAKRALAARDGGDPRWQALIVNMALHTDIPAPRIVQFIEQLAAE